MKHYQNLQRLNILLAALFVNFIMCSIAHASEGINIPEDELARESVLPRFDRPDIVKNRHVTTDKKIEFGFYYGANFTEPIYNQSKLGLNLAYHYNEDSDIGLNFCKWMDGRNSQYVPGIESKHGNIDFNRVPNLEYSAWLNYELKAYYGKISLTKRGVMNLSLYPIFGLGMTKYTNKMYPGANVGIGQKFYLNPNWALRLDFKLQYQQGPNPFLANLGKSPSPAPDDGQFEDKFRLDNILDFGLSVMF